MPGQLDAWVSVEGRPSADLGPAFPMAWQVCEALRDIGVTARVFSVVREWEMMLREGANRIVVPVEETCTIPPYTGDPLGVRKRLQVERIPFTGSEASAIEACSNKAAARERLRRAGLPVPAAVLPRDSELSADIVRRFEAIGSFPAVIKPVLGGGSRGVRFCPDAESLRGAMEAWDGKAFGVPLVEPYVTGAELTVWVQGVGDDVTCARVAEIDRGGRPIFDRAAKAGVPGPSAPAAAEAPAVAVSNADRAAAARVAILAHRALGLFSYSRTDVIVTDHGPVVLEVNARPHLALNGQASVGLGDRGEFGRFLVGLMSDALCRHAAP